MLKKAALLKKKTRLNNVFKCSVLQYLSEMPSVLFTNILRMLNSKFVCFYGGRRYSSLRPTTKNYVIREEAVNCITQRNSLRRVVREETKNCNL